MEWKNQSKGYIVINISYICWLLPERQSVAKSALTDSY